MTSRLVAAYGLYYLDGLPALLRAGVFAYWRRPAASWPAKSIV